VVVALAVVRSSVAGGANMAKVMMWVCDCCGGVYFPDVANAAGHCPSCKGHGKVRACERDDAGVVTPISRE
jgi:uncharacterized OB-fold protein